MKCKTLLLLLCWALLLQGCATVFGGHISECQSKKPARGEPRRKLRPVALAADIVTYPIITLPVDFLTGAIYKPCKENGHTFYDSLLHDSVVVHKYKINDGYYIKGKTEFYLGIGVISWPEISGWMGPPRLGNYISEPSLQTGAICASYRHYLSNHFGIGVTASIDNEDGDISYCNGKIYSSAGAGTTGTSGHYELHTLSIAVESIDVYHKTRDKMLYGYIGLGVTYFHDKCTIFADAPYGPPIPLPSYPYDYKAAQFNFQITPIGVRWGDKVGGFFELGFGYRGIVSGGMTVRL